MDDIRDRLRHVLWIGGGPCAGKSTVSRVLAEKYDLGIYNLDWHYAREDRFRSGPAVRWWGSRSLDERWVDIADDELLRRSTECWSERFPTAVEELLSTAVSGPIIAEGPGALPWLVAPVVRDLRQAVFLVSAQSLRDRIVADRELAGSGVPYRRTRDPSRARSRHRERDRRLSLQIEKSCRDLGLRRVPVGDGMTLETVAAAVEKRFASYLLAISGRRPTARPRR